MTKNQIMLALNICLSLSVQIAQLSAMKTVGKKLGKRV